MGGDSNLPVGPGIWGFIAFFVLAVALWFLLRNMNSRLRRMAYVDRDRAEEAEREVGGPVQDERTEEPRQPRDEGPGGPATGTGTRDDTDR